MGILQNGLQILGVYKWSLIIFFETAIGLGWWGLFSLRINDYKSLALKLTSALSLGCLIMVVLSFTAILLGTIWEHALKYGSLLVLGIGLAGLLDWIRRSRPQG